ncbi:hypothetical protein HY967_02195 [Candidatus Jorgensenbacteria bacterium]|nr:hypothetical protein [Candidatus Jorgensenbacteria bacterium]
MIIIIKIQSIIDYIFKRLLILFEILLLIRLALKFLNANPLTFAVSRFYQFTDEIVAPFQSIFPDFVWRERVIDMVTISSMFGYALIFFFFYILLSFIFAILTKFIIRD